MGLLRSDVPYCPQEAVGLLEVLAKLLGVEAFHLLLGRLQPVEDVLRDVLDEEPT
jgi:hypothetical protein